MKKWNSYYSNRIGRTLGREMIQTVSLWMSIGLLWLSFFSITGEWLNGADVYWKIIVPWILLVAIVCESVLPRINKKRNLICGLFLNGNLLAIGIGFWRYWEEVTQGGLAILEQYVKYFNPYYNANWTVPSGDESQIPVVLTLVMMALWMLVWMLATAFGKKQLLVLFPLVALSLELLVGLSPAGYGVISMFLGAIILLAYQGEAALGKMVLPVAAMISLVLVGRFLGNNIKALESKAGEVLEFQNNLGFMALDLGGSVEVDLYNNTENLNNRQPRYRGKTVMKIMADDQPIQTLYLRGYYGTNWEDGSWTLSDEVFEQACIEKEYSQREMSKFVLEMPNQLMEEIGLEETIEYSIQYYGIGDIAYVPYLINSDSLSRESVLSGDSLIQKELSDRTITVSGTNGLSTSPIIYLCATEIEARKDYQYRRWYNQVARSYLRVPEGMDVIGTAASKIWNEMEKNPYALEYPVLSSLQYAPQTDAGYAAIKTNMYRKGAGEAVKEYLADQMSYSLILDELPADADPIEYALAESHEGYCMHFASAATLILRSLSVPARYVSGYVVKEGEFAYDTEEGCYVAEVKDYCAHAWVEIYYDYVGWIPLEVTAAYNSRSTELPTEQDPEELEKKSEEERIRRKANRPVANTGAEDSEDSNPDKDLSNSEPKDTTNSETSPENTNPDVENKTEQGQVPEDTAGLPISGDSGNGSVKKLMETLMPVIKYICAVGTAFLLCLAIVWFLKRRIKRQDAIICEAIRTGNTREAVRRMSRQIYRALHLRRMKNRRLWFGELGDREYEAALQETFITIDETDWEKYMVILKKFRYSKEQISTEEAEHCYRCYKGVKYDRKKHNI